jgi:hypothetical protein
VTVIEKTRHRLLMLLHHLTCVFRQSAPHR